MDTRRLIWLDLEMTGLSPKTDQIIEIAIKVIEFEKISGKIISVKDKYESFNQPNNAIKDFITKLTGINDDMVKGKNIDWVKVDSILENVDFIVAHNASFDRSFVDRFFKWLLRGIWGGCYLYF